MLLSRIILCLTIILLAPISRAADVYFNSNSISPILLSPPLADKSMEQERELDYIINLQKNASPSDIEKAATERKMSAEMIATPVIPELKRDKYPAVYKLLDKVGNTAWGITDNAKNYWKTTRPYLTDKRVKALIESHSNNSYPSGHTSKSYVLAHVMNMLIPENGKGFYAQAESIAQHSVLVGMHFPHDLEGGKQLALLVVGGLLQNQEFIADLEKAKQELKERPVSPNIQQ